MRGCMSRSLLLAASALLALAGSALAHEHVTVGDKYELTVGWASEPAYAGVPNGLDLKVARLAEDHGHDAEGDDHDPANATHEHAAEPQVVSGAHETLTVTYEYGGKKFQPVDFRPAFGRPGWYTADITPTRPGVYTIHLTGTIEGVEVDARISPHEVADLDETSFPEDDPAGYEIAATVKDLQARVAKLEADVQAQIENPPRPTDAKASPGAGLGIVAVALIVGVVLRRRVG